MMTLIAAALAAAQPAPAPPPADAHSQHMPMGQNGQHEQMKMCDCCKDMAHHDMDRAEHQGHSGE